MMSVVRQFGEFQVGVCRPPYSRATSRMTSGADAICSAQVRAIRARCRTTAGYDAGGRLTHRGKGGSYDGPPTELRSGEIRLHQDRRDQRHGDDFCTWHYKDDTP